MKYPPLIGLALVCIASLTGCNEMQQMQKTLGQRDELQEKMEQLTHESNEMDQQMVTLKKSLPPIISTPQAALSLAQRNEKVYELLEQELNTVITSYEKTQSSVKNLEKELGL